MSVTPATIDALSTDYIQALVKASVKGQAVNPTGDTVQMAFVAVGAKPGTGDWKTGSWDSPAPGLYLAQCLVGPNGGTITLTANITYDVYVKIYDNPETPVINCGQLTAT